MKKGGSGGPSSYVEVTTVVRVLLLQSYKQYPYVHIEIYTVYISKLVGHISPQSVYDPSSNQDTYVLK